MNEKIEELKATVVALANKKAEQLYGIRTESYRLPMRPYGVCDDFFGIWIESDYEEAFVPLETTEDVRLAINFLREYHELRKEVIECAQRRVLDLQQIVDGALREDACEYAYA